MSTLERAIEIAAKAHARQFDKGGYPYILHPLRVMMKMSTDEERIVAVLHDVIEDSDLGLVELQEEGFSNDIITALVCLTKIDKEYTTYIEKIADNKLATRVKFADLDDNMDMSRIQNLTHKDFERYKKYLDAKNYLLSRFIEG